MPRKTGVRFPKRRNNSGSAIVWAMMVGGFLLIMVAATLTISYVYHQRSVRNTYDQQAYLTARSGVDLIVNEFTAGSAQANDLYERLANDPSHAPFEAADVGFDEEKMGTCSLKVTLTEATEATGDTEAAPAEIEVTSTARYKKSARTITARLVGVQSRKDGVSSTEGGGTGGGAGEETLSWYVASYTDGGEG